MNRVKRFFAKLFNRENTPESIRGLRPIKSLFSRAPRVQLRGLYNVSFWPEGGKEFPIGNISTTGIGLLAVPGDLSGGAEPGSVIPGRLEIMGQFMPVGLLIRHLSPPIMGCSFEGDAAALREQIRKHFDIELAALDLVAVDSSTLKQESDGVANWLHGRNNCELYFVSDPKGRILRFHLAYFGNYLEGGAGQRLKIGRVTEDELQDKPKHKGSSLVQWEKTAQAELLEGALKFIAHIPHLNSSQMTALSDLIRQ